MLGHDVRGVGVSSAGHGDVERFSGHAGGHDDVAGVDGGTLGAVCGYGVAQLDVFGDIVRIQSHFTRLVSVAAGGGLADSQCSVGVDGGDLPGVAVPDPSPVSGADSASVLPRDNHVAHAGSGAVTQLHAAGSHRARSDQRGADALVEVGDGGIVGSDQKAVPPRGQVGGPRGVRRVRPLCPHHAAPPSKASG